VNYSLTWPGDLARISARRCGCTFCTKHGGIWTSNPAGALAVNVVRSAQVSRYAFETGTAEFLVCARCGVPPLVTSRIEGRLYAVVNVNTFDDIDPGSIEISRASFEGEAVDDRLARRQRGWIPDVTIEEGTS
jgi:hypothetical protein